MVHWYLMDHNNAKRDHTNKVVSGDMDMLLEMTLSVRFLLSRAYLLCYLIQDHQTWCGSTPRTGAVACTITRSLWSTFLTCIKHQMKTL